MEKTHVRRKIRTFKAEGVNRTQLLCAVLFAIIEWEPWVVDIRLEGEMFTYIKLNNFMSFKEATFDFRNGKKGTKRFAAIYGENGGGKSNFVSSIDFLIKSIDSFYLFSETEKLKELAKEEKVPRELLNNLFNSVNILKYKEDCRMLECEDPTTIEYGFQMNGHDGYYIMSFKDRFLYEKLYYFTGKQKGTIFEIVDKGEMVEAQFSRKLFGNTKVRQEMEEEVSKYWGRHSFLSILNREREEKNEEYIKASYLDYTFDFLDMLREISVHCERSVNSGSEIEAAESRTLIKNLQRGEVKKGREDLLDRSERILCDFFTQAYEDIKGVFYEKKEKNDQIAYTLYVKKMIGGKIRTVPFSKESAGTQQILHIVRLLLGAFCGVTVIYDEIDNGIHDLLLTAILESMVDDITGQLIITTHNTYLLETINPKSAYVIDVDYQGDKEVRCLDKFTRIQGTNNARLMYLKGMFGGVPIIDLLDYDEIIQELREEDGGE